MITLLLIIAIALALFIGILNLQIPGLWKFGLAVIEMAILSHIFTIRYGIENQMGLLLFRSKKGLQIIEKLAKRAEIFKFLSDAGAFMCYGLLSIVIMRKNISLKSALCGLVLLTVLYLIVAPNVVPFLASVLKINIVEKTQASVQQNTSSALFLPIATFMMYIGGLFIVLVLSIIWYAVLVLMALSSSIFGGTDAIAKTEPGGTLILPGVTIPFFEGVLAIVIIMAVHEGAHAILARIGRIKVLSSGIVLFGIIPVGAFVEPDEKQLEKMEKTKQTRVLVAGSSSNLIVSIIAFVLFAMLAITANKFSLMSVSYLAPIIKFLYITLGLTYTLNFVVGTINLLPLPFFDGYRIIDANLENRVIVRGLMYLTLAAFIMNFIPWLFKP